MAIRRPVVSVPEGGNPTLGLEQMPTGDTVDPAVLPVPPIPAHDTTGPTGTGPEFEHYNAAERAVVDGEVAASAAHRVDTANPHAVTAAQAGADPAGTAAIVQGNLNTHEADTANPHSVTAAQAGAAPIAHVGAGGVAEHPVFSNGVEGFVPDPGAGSGLFLRDDGVWATPSGIGIALVWRFETSIVMAAPANTRFRMNNATPASVTALAFDDQTRDGIDASTVLDNLTAGDAIVIQQANDATKYIVLDVVLSTDNAGWFQVDVTVADSGVIFDNNADCVVVITKAGGGTGTPGDQAQVQARRTTNFAIPTASWTDVPFDVTDEENSSGVLDHDLGGNTDNILIASDKGPTEIHVSCIIDAPDDLGDHYRIEARLRTDDAVVIPGSEKQVWVIQDGSLNGLDIGALLDYTVQVDLAGIGFITLQLQKISLDGTGVVNMLPGSTFQAVRLTGQVGAQGPAGAGSTLLFEDEGTPLVGAGDTLNVTGAGATISGAGTTKTLNIPGGGGGGPTETAKATHSVDQAVANAVPVVLAFNSESFDTDTMHDNAVNNSRLTINTAGKWLFGFNGRWENDSAGNRWIRLLKNGTTIVGQDVRNPGTPEWEHCMTFPIQDAIVTDFYEIEVEQDSGGPLDMETAGLPPPTFWAHRQS